MKILFISNETARKFILIKRGLSGENNFVPQLDCPDKQFYMNRRVPSETRSQSEIIPIIIEGIKDFFYCRAEDFFIFEKLETKKFKPHTELISQKIFSNREKRLFEEIFDFTFRGRALAILHDENFVGNVEFYIDKKSKILYVKNIYLKPNVKNTKNFQAVLSKTLKRFAKFNGCKDISISRN